jgi:hypothetical protein
MSEPQPDALRRFLIGVLTTVGWLIIGLGGLCTLGTSVLSGEGHMPLWNWLIPAAILVVGGGLVWAGRHLGRSLDRG